MELINQSSSFHDTAFHSPLEQMASNKAHIETTFNNGVFFGNGTRNMDAIYDQTFLEGNPLLQNISLNDSFLHDTTSNITDLTVFNEISSNDTRYNKRAKMEKKLMQYIPEYLATTPVVGFLALTALISNCLILVVMKNK